MAPATLRTWARRYGIGPTAHESGEQRRYTAADLGRLAHMRRLMLAGVSASEAARSALELATPAGRRLRLGRSREATSTTATPDGPTTRRRAGGGHVIPLREASPAARGLARAAMALDPQACRDSLDASLAQRGVVATWTDLVLPVLGGVGDRWRATGRGVEVEHLFSECVDDCLRARTRELTEARVRAAPPVLLATPEHEAHDLPLLALAAALAEQGVVVRLLGAGLPMTAIADAVARTGAAVLFLWARTTHRRVDPGELTALLDVRPRPVLVVGGPAWRATPARPGVRLVDDLPSGVRAVLGALGLESLPQGR